MKPAERPAGAGSFRDPAGRLFAAEERVLRVVSRAGAEDLNAVLGAKAARSFFDSGRLVRTTVLAPAERKAVLADPEIHNACAAYDAELIVEHERIPFPGYPYEWPPEMLYAAGRLTLELALELLAEGFGLKDGTPYNVLFRGPQPVFVDLLSFERRDPLDPTWLAYGQFTRTFLLPLLANKYFGLPLDFLLTRRDGLEPEEVHRWLGPLQKIRPPFLPLVSMPTWLGRRRPDDERLYRQRSAGSPEKARFILETLLKGLRRTLDRLQPKAGRPSAWSAYLASNNNYSAEQFQAKTAFVRQALQDFAPRSVLDVGCNTGYFSSIAARAGARVVAIDADPVVAGEVWRLAAAERLDILPLVVNLTRPTPAAGWRNREHLSFLSRARGAFDCVLLLAVIHHMLVSERVPLTEILETAADLTTDIAVVEFIGPEDCLFRRLTRGREALHKDLNSALFEQLAARHFEILRRQPLPGAQRWLYVLKRQ